MPLFNGRRLIAVASGGYVRQRQDDGRRRMAPLDPPGVGRDALAGLDCEFLELQHEPKLRETAALVPLLERLESRSPNEAIFRAHAKGVTHPVNPGVSVTRWTEILYETALDYWPLAQRQLEDFGCTGSFKKVGSYFGTPSAFHYSGSFYWLRSADLFARDWRRVDLTWYGVEPYPGQQFRPEEAGCLFWEQGGVLDLYNVAYFRDSVEPAYAAWKEAHAPERTER